MAAQTVEKPAKFSAEWNDSTPTQRKKLMQAAGYQSNQHWIYRAWSFIPFSIREDVIAVIKKQKRASTPNTAAPAPVITKPQHKPYWWEEKEMEPAND